MVQRWLIHMHRGNMKAPDDQVSVVQTEQAAVKMVGDIAVGLLEQATLKSVYKVDLINGTMTEYELKLEKMQLILVPKHRPDPFETIHPGQQCT